MTAHPRTSAAGSANEAATRLRELAHLTHPTDGFPGVESAGDVCEVLGTLSLLADSLGQTLDHLSGWLDWQAQSGLLAAPHGHPEAESATSIAAAGDWLQRAHDAATKLRGAVGSAEVIVAGLTDSSSSSDNRG